MSTPAGIVWAEGYREGKEVYTRNIPEQVTLTLGPVLPETRGRGCQVLSELSLSWNTYSPTLAFPFPAYLPLRSSKVIRECPREQVTGHSLPISLEMMMYQLQSDNAIHCPRSSLLCYPIPTVALKVKKKCSNTNLTQHIWVLHLRSLEHKPLEKNQNITHCTWS